LRLLGAWVGGFRSLGGAVSRRCRGWCACAVGGVLPGWRWGAWSMGRGYRVVLGG